MRYNFDMRAGPSNLFLTFVLGLALTLAIGESHAATSPLAPDLDTPQTGQKTEPAPNDVRDTVDIAVPPPPPPKDQRADREYFYPFRQAITIRLGTVVAGSGDSGNLPAVGGVQYFHTFHNLLGFEGDADLLSDGTGALAISVRHGFTRTEFRPYLKWGMNILVEPRDQLVNFIKYEHYRAEGAAGFEYLIRGPMSARAEVEALVGSTSFEANVTLGYVWAW